MLCAPLLPSADEGIKRKECKESSIYQLKYRINVRMAIILDENSCQTLPSFSAGGMSSMDFSEKWVLFTLAALFNMRFTSSFRSLLRSQRHDSGIILGKIFYKMMLASRLKKQTRSFRTIYCNKLIDKS